MTFSVFTYELSPGKPLAKQDFANLHKALIRANQAIDTAKDWMPHQINNSANESNYVVGDLVLLSTRKL